jgi:PKD repeat protein
LSNAPPAAAFTPSCALLICTFADGSTDADGQVTGYTWDFGDGATAATTKDAQHTFAAANTYTVSLTVTDNDGASDGATQSVQVTAPAPANEPPTPVGPTSNFADSCAVVGHYGRIVFFDCTFTDQSTAAAGATVTAWAWDFGDGRTSTAQNPPVHHYSISWRPGVHVFVRLTVTDNNGLTNGVARSIQVSTPSLTAAPTIALGLPIGFVRTGSNLCYPAISYSTRGGCYSSVNLSITNAGGGTLNWTGTTSATWLRISPKSGTAPSTMKVWVNGTGVARGSYDGEIRVSATGAANSPKTVVVHFTKR